MASKDIVIDCDPGIDDALAICLALASPELRLRGLTTVAGNRDLETVTRNASRLLALAGRPDVPVYPGCSRPILTPSLEAARVHGGDGLGGAALPEPQVGARAAHAVDFLIETIRSGSPHSLTLAAIGPLTNVALAFIKAPDVIARLDRIVLMGGASFGPPRAEFNFRTDPAAAHVVLDSGARVVMFGLDVTEQVRVGAEGKRRFHALASRCGQALAAMLDGHGEAEPALHDPCAIAYLIDATLFVGRQARIVVDYCPGPLAGRVLAQAGSQTLAMTEADAPRLIDLMLARLAALP